MTIDSLRAACGHFLEEYAARPERDATAAFDAAMNGRRREHPVLYLGHLYCPEDRDPLRDEYEPPEVRAPDTPEGDLAREVVGMLEPLRLLNPIAPVFGLGYGPGTLVNCFGIPLNPEMANAPAFTRSAEKVMAEPPPDPFESGFLPEMRRRVELILERTPEEFKITLPDTQGPFNLAHSIVGEEVMLLPFDDPGLFHALMERITTLSIAVVRNVGEWIGPGRLAPGSRVARIAECSVNLVSPDFYREFILPHDRRIADEFGGLHIHPCSGPHVFRVTMENLPVVLTEAGHIATTAAGAITVDEALAEIGKTGRRIAVGVGQELPEGEEYEFIRADLDRLREHPGLTLSYTGMHWRRKDRPLIRDIHRRLDAYWADSVRK